MRWDISRSDDSILRSLSILHSRRDCRTNKLSSGRRDGEL